MWIAAQRFCDNVQSFSAFSSDEAVAELVKQIEQHAWQLQNVTLNRPPSEKDRTRISPGSEVEIEAGRPTVRVDQQSAEVATVLSNAFKLNEIDALDLVFTAEIQRHNFDGLPLGLVAVVCYYDAHRRWLAALRGLLEWEREGMPKQLVDTIRATLMQPANLRHMIDLQSSWTVHGEFTRLGPHGGIGNAIHQSILRSLIDEIRVASAECAYSICSEANVAFLDELMPRLKKLQASDRFLSVHLVSWTAVLALIATKAIHQAPPEAALVLSSLVDEIKNETTWGDLCVCGSVQLAVAVAIKDLELSPLDHSAVSSLKIDVDILAGRAIPNLALRFIRYCIVESEIFRASAVQLQLTDALLKGFILLFPPKLMELERHSEDELVFVDEMAEKGSSFCPDLHLDNLLRALTGIYAGGRQEEETEKTQRVRDALSKQFSYEMPQLCHFAELATRPHHALNAIAFLDMLRAICRTPPTATLLFQIFSEITENEGGFTGFLQLFEALKAYDRLFREAAASTAVAMSGGYGGTLGVSLKAAHHQQAPPTLPKRELAGLVSWLELATKICELDADAARSFCEKRAWNAIELCTSLVVSPVPIHLKGSLLRFLGALARLPAMAQRIWAALANYRICLQDDLGQLQGLQRELDEQECAARDYSCTLGAAYLFRSLLAHPLPAAGSPTSPTVSACLLFLTRSVLSQLEKRSYDNSHQMWELATVSLEALHALLQQTHADSFAVTKREPPIGILLQLLNDTPLLRSVFAIISEDVSHSAVTHTAYRPSASASRAALRLLLAAANRSAPLRAAVRGADSDAMLATLDSLCMSSFGSPEKGCLLIHAMHYLTKASDQPVHALLTARLLREVCAVRPSVQTRMVETLRATTLHIGQYIRAAHSILTVDGGLVYSVDNVNEMYSSPNVQLDESNEGAVRGETARLLIEIMAEGAETDTKTDNMASFLLGINMRARAEEALYQSDALPTGLESLLEMMEHFITAADPFDLPFSALFEPGFRLILRLVKYDNPRAASVLRYIRGYKFIYRLLSAPFIRNQAVIRPDVSQYENPTTIASVSAIITGNILHLAALELSHLLTTGQVEAPQLYYRALLEANVVCEPSTMHSFHGVESSREEDRSILPADKPTPLLFALLRNGRTQAVDQPFPPRLDCFDAQKIKKLLDLCRVSTAFDVEQYNVPEVCRLLTREIHAVTLDDATRPNREMEDVLRWATAMNASMLASAAGTDLLSGCAALLNVFALFAPVPFFSVEPQLAVLLEASFVLIEAASAHSADVALVIAHTLLRVSRAVSSLARQQYLTDIVQRRQQLDRLLRPLLELLVQPGERPVRVKLSLYTSLHVVLRECATATEDEAAARAEEKEDDWLTKPFQPRTVDPIHETIAWLASELVRTITADITDFPAEQLVAPVLVLGELFGEDSRGSCKLCGLLSRDGIPRALLDLLCQLPIENLTHPTLRAARAVLALLTRMCSYSECWRALSVLSLPEALCIQFDVLKTPPKQLFLDPTSINKPGCEARVYGALLDDVFHLCMALLTNAAWKQLSIQVLSLLDCASDLLSQLLRAEVACSVVETATSILVYIHEHDIEARPYINESRTLSALKERGDRKKGGGGGLGVEEAPQTGYSFIAPGRLFPSQVVRS